MKILGILNITDDSFSDGGKYLAPEAALAHGLTLMEEGADILDIGAASSNPDAKIVSPETEIARLAAVLSALRKKGAIISIDSFSAPVQRWALAQGVDYLNDIHGFAQSSFYPDLAAAKAKLVVMHAIQGEGAATRADIPAGEIFDRAVSFFDKRLGALAKAGIESDRLILDPGMGFFVGSDPENSLTLLRRLPDLKTRFGLPLLVSVSRKSFLRKITGQSDPAGAAVLAAGLAVELYAYLQGADYLRTHAPGALKAALKLLSALNAEDFNEQRR
ncbi:MAG TPA: dihydropteroate synthase [Rhizomicrobium sp.]|jgi:dihydropteroate synthase type 2|nr:dihydropteroate synthase [Rhizomicrobium sp.]